MSITELPDLMTRQQLAEFTGVSVQTIARWAVKGRTDPGPRMTKLGNSVRYQKKHVIEWLEASKVQR